MTAPAPASHLAIAFTIIRTIALSLLRIVHLSDIHVWRLAFNPARLLNKRLFGVASLLAGRARKFRLERLEGVVERALQLRPDHVLITGDLTTTALPGEFQAAREVLSPLLADPERATVIPGNHDRYTRASARNRWFERTFGRYAGGDEYPWVRRLDESTAILALDPTRAAWSARGLLPPAQLAAARELWLAAKGAINRWIIACHYPIDAPAAHRAELRPKRLLNAAALADWLATIGPHLYCCGHVHRAWAFAPPAVPNEICLNAGAPLMHDRSGANPPGFLEIVLDGATVTANHHFWDGRAWGSRVLINTENFFRENANARRDSAQTLRPGS